MKKRTKAQRVREFFEENREQFERTDKLLRERIEYHRRKGEEERLRRERSLRARLARAIGRS
jgi:hypothetical protein